MIRSIKMEVDELSKLTRAYAAKIGCGFDGLNFISSASGM